MNFLPESILRHWDQLQHALNGLSPQTRGRVMAALKIGAVLGAYVVCLLGAVLFLAAGAYVLIENNGERLNAMNAMAVFLIYLCSLGLAVGLPSMLGLYFLRPYPAFWRWCSGVAMAVAGVGMLGTMLRLKVSRMVSGEELLLVVVGTACLAVVFGVCACFTPSGSRGPRWGLVAAAGLEIGTFASWIAFAATTPQVTVVNQAGTELTNIVASGRGFRVSVGALAAGKQRRVGVQASGESGLQLEFDANGQHFITHPNAYLEDHAYYHYKVIVAPDFTVSVTTLD